MQTFPTPLSLWDQHIRPRVSSKPHRLRIGFIHVNKNDDFELGAHDESLKKPSTCTCTIKRPKIKSYCMNIGEYCPEQYIIPKTGRHDVAENTIEVNVN